VQKVNKLLYVYTNVMQWAQCKISMLW